MISVVYVTIISVISFCISLSLYNTLERTHFYHDLHTLTAGSECCCCWRHEFPDEKRQQRLGLHSHTRHRLRRDFIVVCTIFNRGVGLDPSFFFFLPMPSCNCFVCVVPTFLIKMCVLRSTLRYKNQTLG